jgi:spore coat polysaccharide biosynthesis protein SpsF (cytidylyltransferase family)
MTIAIIQARLTSTRLPGKVMEMINGKTMLDRIISRISICKEIDLVVVASPHDINVDIPIFIGDENDVLDRYYQCAKHYGADTIVRITSDCPMIDPDIISFALHYFRRKKYPYVYIAPVDGLDVEVFSIDMLREAWENTTEKSDREHVTLYMKRATKISVDTAEDLAKIRKLVNELEG